jgi:hypothetical protein
MAGSLQNRQRQPEIDAHANSRAFRNEEALTGVISNCLTQSMDSPIN